MRVPMFFLLCVCSVTLCAGCAPTTRYYWNDYDNKLYQHYKNPAEYDQFVAQLQIVIDRGEEAGKVPPGLYAEYGFALYEKGRLQEAVKYFKLESDKWPESRVLMAKMINNAQKRDKQGTKQNQTNAPKGSEFSSGSNSEAMGATR